MPVTIPTQEIAYSLPTCTISTINKLFVQVTWNEYYNFNVDASTYTGYTTKYVSIPMASIAIAYEINNDETASELSTSLVIKNGNATVLSLNNNNINTDSQVQFTQTDFSNIYDSVYGGSIA